MFRKLLVLVVVTTAFTSTNVIATTHGVGHKDNNNSLPPSNFDRIVNSLLSGDDPVLVSEDDPIPEDGAPSTTNKTNGAPIVVDP